VDGCDFVPEAVERLREVYGTTGSFTEADVSAAGGLGSSDRRYNLVSCMNVLLHVLDEAAFDRAATNIAALVSPGGHLLLAEPIARDPTFATVPGPGDTSRVRSLSRYAAAFEAHGLRLVRHAPTTLLGANPIESRPRRLLLLWRAWWGLVVWGSRLSSRLGWLAGRLIYALDPLALKSGAAPSGKFALFRRDVSPS
jgi:hypothetical protein